MAKIIKQAEKFKPVTCEVCGCEYEFEQGDKLKTVIYDNASNKVTVRYLDCPFCSSENILSVDKEKQGV